MSNAEDQLLSAAGPSSPPRANGELVFEAPWERQVFGIAMALVDTGAFSYAEFQQGLIAEIARWDAGERPEHWSYYHCWAKALELKLIDDQLVDESKLEDLVGQLAARPHGHDHH